MGPLKLLRFLSVLLWTITYNRDTQNSSACIFVFFQRSKNLDADYLLLSSSVESSTVSSDHVSYHQCLCLRVSVVPLRQCLETEDDLQQLQSDGVPSEVTDWLASTFTQRVRRPVRRSDEKPKFRSIVHAVQAGIFVERYTATTHLLFI